MKALVVSWAKFPMFQLCKELMYAVQLTTATKMKRRAQQTSVAPEMPNDVLKTAMMKIQIVRMDLSIVLSNPQ